ncbi:tetraspanin-15-like [Canna indica]|uniref:Tetraspanin-15-like n=1 Tax=Canna indica TaxID=4628 RepID=A0AAQ3JUG0_9LILI|nr:tetraspanin-15-like [Canna indica]
MTHANIKTLTLSTSVLMISTQLKKLNQFLKFKFKFKVLKLEIDKVFKSLKLSLALDPLINTLDSSSTPFDLQLSTRSPPTDMPTKVAPEELPPPPPLRHGSGVVASCFIVASLDCLAFIAHLFLSIILLSLAYCHVLRVDDCGFISAPNGLPCIGLMLVLSAGSLILYFRPRDGAIVGRVALFVIIAVTAAIGAYFMASHKVNLQARSGPSAWLRNRVMDAQVWESVKNCFREDDFNFRAFSLETECCKPPEGCRMEKGNEAHNSTAPAPAAAPPMSDDCRSWSSNPGELCYDCESCKKGFVKAMASTWKKILATLVELPLVILVVHTLRLAVVICFFDVCD